ncbi:hypothetical protein [Leptolyngbya sp. FACHB-16]|uniref:hypothetical protein n=1 Tax=unclassified Leptolyngbya TaxID=2650499 RepID=UPI00168A1F5A|nr:hypothetical protein [Leptolyngbya sp. FACHB-16]MBD2156303.1 hypothetical protein [Leptolyngbya sp. FACHB-16]
MTPDSSVPSTSSSSLPTSLPVEQSKEENSSKEKISLGKEIVANLCLLIWAILLAVIGMQAVSGQASTIILESADKINGAPTPKGKASTSGDTSSKKIVALKKIAASKKVAASKKIADPSVALSNYLEDKYSGEDKALVPPIGIVLDQLQVNVNWRNSKAIDEANGPRENEPTAGDYDQLFAIVDNRISAIANFSPEVSISSNLRINNNILPSNFRSTGFKDKEIDLPLEAVLWVKATQTHSMAREAKIGFLDLLVLLIILGGFGSWIYLVRKHVDPNTPVSLKEYFYRPPLGMALAIAIFIVNITLHSFVSTSNVNEVRRETLILLAFTAGLLSDKTYNFIERVIHEEISKNEIVEVETKKKVITETKKEIVKE